MNRREFLRAAGVSAMLTAGAATPPPAAPRKPNIIFILADDLGYGELGCYGQRVIQTPNIDRLAAEGLRFTQCYAGSTVCAPSRCCLMTGLHTGHATIRGNANVPLRPEDTTVAEILKSQGYATGLIGKWGLGEPGTSGIPNRKGFDEFYGYLNQKHAHNYYPDYLWRNETREALRNVEKDGVASVCLDYAPDLFTREALDFVQRRREGPFFLYLTYIIPHANNERGAAGGNGMEVPDDAPYHDQPWPQVERNHAAMITRLDRDVGRLMERLKQLGLDDNTLVFFSSDNGPHKEGGANPQFFHSSGPLRGIKRDLYEGGIRVPMIARWPGVISPGRESGHVWAFWDLAPTLAELSGAPVPHDIDGVSALPALIGARRAGHTQRKHEFLYWEFHEGGFGQAVLQANWKAVRPKPGAPIELYDLSRDPGEQRNLAAKYPRRVSKLASCMRNARTESKDWPVRQTP